MEIVTIRSHITYGKEDAGQEQHGGEQLIGFVLREETRNVAKDKNVWHNEREGSSPPSPFP